MPVLPEEGSIEDLVGLARNQSAVSLGGINERQGDAVLH